MAVIEIRVPAIAESVTEVTLSQWLKADGEMVKLDEPICEFESDKATLELPAEVAGKIKHVATEGSDLKIGDVVATIDTDAAELVPPSRDASSPAPVAAAPKAAEPTPSVPTPQTATYATGVPSPTAGKVLAEANIPTSDVQGTGRDGRITQADAQNAANAKSTHSVVAQPIQEPVSAAPVAPKADAKPAAATPSVSTPSEAFSRSERRVKMSRMRQTIAKRLVSAKNCGRRGRLSRRRQTRHCHRGCIFSELCPLRFDHVSGWWNSRRDSSARLV